MKADLAGSFSLKSSPVGQSFSLSSRGSSVVGSLSLTGMGRGERWGGEGRGGGGGREGRGEEGEGREGERRGRGEEGEGRGEEGKGGGRGGRIKRMSGVRGREYEIDGIP